MIDDIREGRDVPKRYPLIDCQTDRERQGCDIIFAYDFNKAESFTKQIEQFELQVPLDLIDEEAHVGKADGMLKFEEFLPFHRNSLEDFLSLLNQIIDGDYYQDLTFESIKETFYENQEWKQAFEISADVDVKI